MADFVTRSTPSGNLLLNGQRFKMVGANSGHLGLTSANNAYGGIVNAEGRHLATHAEIDAALDSLQAMGANTIRAYGQVMSVGALDTCQPTLGVFNDAAFEPADYLLQQCAIRNIKVMFPLVDNYTYAGMNGKFWYCTANGVTPDAEATQFFTNSTVIASFKAFVNYVVNRVNQYTEVRYGDDPTIIAWETGNELNTGSTGVSMNAWTGEISTYIKTTCNAQQLVADGRYGIVGADNVTADAAQLALPNVDMYSTHSYDQWRTPENVELQAAAAHAAGKAFFLGEYTWTDSASSYWTLAQMLSKVETSKNIDGDLFWQLMPPLTNWGDGYTLHQPGDTADMISRVNRLTGHAKNVKQGIQKVEIVAYSNNSGSTNDRSTSFGTYWDPQENDLVVFFVGSTANTGIVVPSGWFNPFGGTAVGATSVNTMIVLAHWVTATEGTNNTRSYAINDFMGTATGNVVGIVLRGVNTTTPVATSARTIGNTAVTPHSIPALTGSNVVNGSKILACIVKDETGDYTPPPNYNRVWWSNQNQNTWVGEWKELGEAGVDIPVTTITPSGSDEYAAGVIAFAPALTVAPTDTLIQPASSTLTLTGNGPPADVAGLIRPSAATLTLFRSTPDIVTPSETGGVTGFVVRDPATGYLMLNGRRYRFSGTNAAGSGMGLSESNSNATQYGGTGQNVTINGRNYLLNLSTHASVDALISAAVEMNTSVIRTFAAMTIGHALAVSPSKNVYSDANLEPLDYALQQCAANNIRVILPLCDNYKYFMGGKFDWASRNGVVIDDPGGPQFFTNATIRADLKNFISFVLNHVNPYTGLAYKDDPTILAWETGNELDNGGTWSAPYVEWTNDISTHIKVTCGAKQLVMDGKLGIATTLGGSTLDTASLELPYVDMYTSHPYGATSFPHRYITNAEIAHTYGKAYCIGETTWTDMNASAVQNDWRLPEMLTQVGKSKDMDGFLYWELLPKLTNFSSTLTFHWPGDTADMTARGHTLRDNAALVNNGKFLGVSIQAAEYSSTSGSRSRSISFATAAWEPRENDVLAVFASSGGSTNVPTIPAGWVNALGGNTTIASDQNAAVCVYHVVTAAEAAAATRSYTLTNLWGTSATGNTVAVVLRGVNTSNPIDAIASFADPNNATSPYLLPGLDGANLSNNSLVLGYVSKDESISSGITTPVGYGILVTTDTQARSWLGVRNSPTKAGENVPGTDVVLSTSGDEYVSITVAFNAIPVIDTLIEPTSATLALSGKVPVATAAANRVVAPTHWQGALTTFAPTIVTPRLASPTGSTLALSFAAPSIEIAPLSIGFDAIGTGGGPTRWLNSQGGSLNWTHTASGNDRVVMVWVAGYREEPDPVFMSATYDGIPMTSLGQFRGDGNAVDALNTGFIQPFILFNPPTGPRPVQVGWSVTPHIVARIQLTGNSVSYTGATSYAGITDSFGTETGEWLSLTVPSAPGRLVVQGFIQEWTSGLANYNRNERFRLEDDNYNYSALVGDSPGAASVVFTANRASGADYAEVAVDLLPAAHVLLAPAGATITVTGRVASIVQTFNQLLTPASATLVDTFHAPAVLATARQWLYPTRPLLVITGAAPTVVAPNNQFVTPPGATLVDTFHAPTILTPRRETPGSATAAISGKVPTVATTAHQWIYPSGTTRALTGSSPVVTASNHQVVVPIGATLIDTFHAPVILTPRRETPGSAATAIIGRVPTVAATAHQWAYPSGTTRALTGSSPVVTASNHQVVVPVSATLVDIFHAPVVATTAHQFALPPRPLLVISGATPMLAVSNHQAITPASATLIDTFHAPTVTVTAHQFIGPLGATFSLSALAAAVLAPRLIVPAGAAMIDTFHAPLVTASNHQVVAPANAAMIDTFHAPIVLAPRTEIPVASSLGLSGRVPTVALTAHQLVVPAVSAMVDTFHAPVVYTPRHEQPGNRLLTLVGPTPAILLSDNKIANPTGSLLVDTFHAPVVLAPRYLAPTAAVFGIVGAEPGLGQSDNVRLIPAAAVLSDTFYAPIVLAPRRELPPGSTATLTGTVATILLSDNKAVTPAGSSRTLTGWQPTVTATGHQWAVPTAASLVDTFYAPNILLPQLVRPSAATIALTGSIPSAQAPAYPVSSGLTLSTAAPSVGITDIVGLRPNPAIFTLTSPSTAVRAPALPTLRALTLTGSTPFVATSDLIVVRPAATATSLSVSAPIIFAPQLPSGSLLTFATAVPVIGVSDLQATQPAAHVSALAGSIPVVITPRREIPNGGGIALSGSTPAVFTPRREIPDGRLTALAGSAPSVALSDNKAIAPAVANIAIDGWQSTVTASNHQRITPTGATLTITPTTPGVLTTAHQRATPTGAVLTDTFFVPTVSATGHQFPRPTGAGLAMAGSQPNLFASDQVVVRPAPEARALVGYAPALTITAHQRIIPTSAARTLAGATPTIVASDHQRVSPAGATVTLTGHSSVAATTNYQFVRPATGNLALTFAAPNIDLSDHKKLGPAQRGVSITGGTPGVLAPRYVIPAAMTTSVVSSAPRLNFGVFPASVGAALTGYAPVVVGVAPVEPSPDPFVTSLTGHPPSLIPTLPGQMLLSDTPTSFMLIDDKPDPKLFKILETQA